MIEALILCVGLLHLADADSGEVRCFDGRVAPFRLHGWDAPETRFGGRGGAACVAEAARGRAVRRAARAAFEGAVVATAGHRYFDAGRRSVSDPVLADGRRLSAAFAAEGWIVRWDYDGGAPKPDWCGPSSEG